APSAQSETVRRRNGGGHAAGLAMVFRRIVGPLLAFLFALAPLLCAGQSYEKLLWSAAKGDVPTVSALLSQGLDPNTADSEGNTLLMLAARNGHDELVAFLINHKADVNKRSPHGDSALMAASLKGHLGTVKLLLANGAELSPAGWTPLHYAAFEGRPEVIKYLLDKRADKNGLAPNGYTALMLAARNGHVAAARELLFADADYAV